MSASYQKTAEMTNMILSEDRSVPSTFQETAIMSKPDQNDSIIESLQDQRRKILHDLVITLTNEKVSSKPITARSQASDKQLNLKIQSKRQHRSGKEGEIVKIYQDKTSRLALPRRSSSACKAVNGIVNVSSLLSRSTEKKPDFTNTSYGGFSQSGGKKPPTNRPKINALLQTQKSHNLIDAINKKNKSQTSHRHSSQKSLPTQSGYLELPRPPTVSDVIPVQPVDQQTSKAEKFRRFKRVSRCFWFWQRQHRLQMQKIKLGNMFHESRIAIKVIQGFRNNLLKEKVKISRDQGTIDLIKLFRKHSLYKRHFYRLLLATKQLKTAKGLIVKISQQKHSIKLQSGFNILYDHSRESQGNQMYELILIQKCFGAFKIQTANNSQKRELQTRARKLRFRVLSTKSIASLLANRDNQIKKRSNQDKKRAFYASHRQRYLKKLALSTLKLYAIQKQKLGRVKKYNELSMKNNCFDKLRNNVGSAQKKRDTQVLVATFYRCQLAQKSFNIISSSAKISVAWHHQVLKKSNQLRLKLLYKAWREEMSRIQRYVIKNGNMLMAAKNWLNLSFGPMMDQVWLEFPAQKIDKDQGNVLFLKNYLKLSSQAKYRQFFFDTNQSLRQHIKRQCFYSIFVSGRENKQIKAQKRLTSLQNIWNAFKKVIYPQILCKKFAAFKTTKDSFRLQRKAFDSLKKATVQHKLLTDKMNFVSKKHETRLLKSKLSEWYYMKRKMIVLQKGEQLSKVMSRKRQLATYMAAWLTKLHLNLKKKHFKQIQEQFIGQKRKQNTFSTWRAHYCQLKQLEAKNSELSHLTEKRMQLRCILALRNYATKSHKTKHIKQKADQEYLYWQVSKTFRAFQKFRDYRQGKKNLLAQIEDDYDANLIQKTFSTLRMYTSYKFQQRQKDQFLTYQIHAVRKQTILKSWNRNYSNNLGLRLLSASLQSTHLRIGFYQIRKVQIQQAAIVETLAEKRKDRQHIIYGPFNRWRTFCTKKKVMKTKAAQFRYKQQAHLLFMNWLGRSRQIQQNFRMFDNLIRAFKHVLQVKAFGVLKNKLILRRQKDVAQQLYPFNLQKKCIQSLHEYSIVKKNLAQKSLKVKKIYSKVVLDKTFSEWLARFNDSLNLKERFKQALITKKGKIFRQGLKQYWEQKLQNRKHFKNLTKSFILFKAHQSFRKIKHLAQQANTDEHRKREARIYHSRYLYNKTIQAWCAYYRSQRPLVKKQEYIKAKVTLNKKNRLVKIWKRKAVKSLDCVHSASNLNRVMNKHDKRILFSRWANETNYLNDLEARTQQCTHIIRVRRARSALQFLFKFSQTQKIDKVKLDSVTDYADHKLKLKVLAAFLDHRDRFQRSRHNRNESEALYYQTQTRKIFNSLREYASKRILLRQSQFEMKRIQMELYGREYLQTWINNVNENRQSQENNIIADEHYVLSLLSLGFKSLLGFAVQKSRRAFQMSKASEHYYCSLQAKAIRGLDEQATLSKQQSVECYKSQITAELHPMNAELFSFETVECGTQTLKSADESFILRKPIDKDQFTQTTAKLTYLLKSMLIRRSTKAKEVFVNLRKYVSNEKIGDKFQAVVKQRYLRKAFVSGWLQAYRQPQTRQPYGVFAYKLGNIILPSYKLNNWVKSYQRRAFQAINDHAASQLDQVQDSYISESKQSQQRNAMQGWLDTVLRRNSFKKIDRIVIYYSLRMALATWREKVQIQENQEVQATIIHKYFELKRPEALLMCYKTFLQLYQCSGKVKMCSISLQKYVLESWRAALPALRKDKELNQQVKQFRHAVKYREFLSLWQQTYRKKRKLNCLQVYGTQTYFDRLQSKAIAALFDNAKKLRGSKRVLCEQMANQRIAVTATNAFQAWKDLFATQIRRNENYEYFQQAKDTKNLARSWIAFKQGLQVRIKNREIVDEMQGRHAANLAIKVISVLRDFCQFKQSKMAHTDIANQFRSHNLLHRAFNSLKLHKALSQSKSAYSRLFAVFTAWKTHVHESKLLNKYLAESSNSKVFHTISYHKPAIQHEEQTFTKRQTSSVPRLYATSERYQDQKLMQSASQLTDEEFDQENYFSGNIQRQDY